MKRSRLVWWGAGVVGIAGVAALAGCPASAIGDCDNGNCDSADGSSGEGGKPDGGPSITDGSSTVEGGNVVDAPPGCDVTKLPKDSPACIDEGVGVFVDSNAAAGGMGTRAAPFKSISDAVAGNSAGRPRIYVCEGSYSENVVESNLDIYGGFTCAGGKWAYDGNKAGTTKVTGANDGAMKFAALHLTATKSVQIADIEFAEDNAPANGGGSSIGAWVEGAGSVTFTNVTLSAGAGADAAPAGAAEDNSSDKDPTGSSTNTAAAATGKLCTCKAFGKTSAGGGGAAGDPAGVGTPGSGNPATVPSGIFNGAGGQGFDSVAGHNCANGNPGANGASRDAGVGAVAIGVLTVAGWVPGAGSPGLAGGPGQGGGGGGGDNTGGNGGGGGGCGGCGGGGGTGGNGGGASFGLLVVDTGIKTTGGVFHSSAAGKGAAGGIGGVATMPGTKGTGGCNAGNGGNGAGGGGGGGGAGGASAAIAWRGSAPNNDPSTKLEFAAAAALHGAGGGGGTAVGTGPGGLTGSDGVDGVAVAVLQLTK